MLVGGVEALCPFPLLYPVHLLHLSVPEPHPFIINQWPTKLTVAMIWLMGSKAGPAFGQIGSNFLIETTP